MKNTIYSYGLFTSVVAVSAGSAWLLHAETNTALRADITLQEQYEKEYKENENSKENITNEVIEKDSLSAEEKNAAEILDISPAKQEAKKSDITEISEHKAVETSEIFGLARTQLSLRLKKEKAIGTLSFDKVYAQEFKTSEKEFDIPALQEYIERNISFISNQETSCKLKSAYIPLLPSEKERAYLYDTYSFEIMVTCPKKIESARVENTLFTENGENFAHFVNMYTRKRTTIQNLAGHLLTPQIPVLYWNTPESLDTTDTDSDGLFDAEEKVYGTNVNLADTDGDGNNDYNEIERGTDPLVPHTY